MGGPVEGRFWYGLVGRVVQKLKGEGG